MDTDPTSGSPDNSAEALDDYHRVIDEMSLVADELRRQHQIIAAMSSAMAGDGWVSIRVLKSASTESPSRHRAEGPFSFVPSEWPDADRLVKLLDLYQDCRRRLLDAYDRLPVDVRASAPIPPV